MSGQEKTSKNDGGGVVGTIFRNNVRQFMMIGELIIIWMIFALLTNRVFLSSDVRFFRLRLA